MPTSHSLSNRRNRIAVIGPSQASPDILADAEEIGQCVAKAGAILICGGLGGVMEAAARGAKQAGGLTVGILPGRNASDANQWIDVPVVTGMGEARNAIVVRSADAVIAVGGAFGTLSEIALALRLNIPVVGLRTWQLTAPDRTPVPIIPAESSIDAVDQILNLWRLDP